MTLKTPIYMDYSATTPVDERVARRCCGYMTREAVYGNPASRSHSYGWAAEAAVEAARRGGRAGGCRPEGDRLHLGATESDNLAIKGVAHFYQKKGGTIVTCKTEHKAVLDTCRQLEREGYEVTYLDPEPNGLIDLEVSKPRLRDDTTLVSIMHVNNEIGVIQDIAAIGALCRAAHIVFHVDGAQSAGKVPIDSCELPVDLMSFSAHKIYGPKGIGALYVQRKPECAWKPQMHGGGHERGLRSGTLATHQIVGMGEAFRLARAKWRGERTPAGLRNRLWDGPEGHGRSVS